MSIGARLMASPSKNVAFIGWDLHRSGCEQRDELMYLQAWG